MGCKAPSKEKYNIRRYTKEILKEAIDKCKSWAEVCRFFGCKIAGGTQINLKRRAISFEIDFSHFLGKAHLKGRNYVRVPIEKYLTNELPSKSHRLKLRLLKEGLKEHMCEKCGLTEWRSNPIPLELHHIDGSNSNNNWDNIELLCPNCHAQEPVIRT
jgi:hypothetical protein